VNRLGALLLSMAAALPLQAQAQAQAPPLLLDPAASWVQFEVLHFGVSTLRGRLGPAVGTVDLAAGSVSVTVDTASVNTGIGVFDARLRQADLLAAADHPRAFFVSRNLRFAGPQLVAVRGEFTFRGVSQPLELRALRYACRDDTARAEQVCGGDFEAELLRSDFGATFGLPFVADRVRLVVQVEGRRALVPR
jgi:polyisoprenoid-binding protein YceI